MKKAILGVAVLLLSRVAPSTTPPQGQEVVAWMEIRGLSAADGALEKLSPDGRDAGAVSTRSIRSGDGYLEFSVAGPSGGVACGLTRHGHDVGYEEIDFGLLLDAQRRFSIVESGRAQGTRRSYAPSDRFRIAVENGVVVYRQNGELFFTSGSPVHYPLRVQTSLRGTGSGLRNLVLGGALVENVEWVGDEGTRTYANDVAKARGGEKGGSVAVSAQALSDDGLVEWQIDDAMLGAALGLVSADPASLEGDAENFDHALLVRGHTLLVVEGEALPEPVGTVQPGDRLAIAVRGEDVEYRLDGRSLMTSTLRVPRPLRIKAVLHGLGAAVDGVVLSGSTVRLVGRPPAFTTSPGHYEEPVHVGIEPGAAGAAVTYTTHGAPPTESDTALGARETVLVAGDTTLLARSWPKGEPPGAVRSASYTLGSVVKEDVVWKVGTDGQAASTREITSLDGFIEVTVTEPPTRGAIGLSTSDRSSRGDFGFGFLGRRLYVREHGRRGAVVGAVQPGDRLRVAVEAGLVKYRQNGYLLATSHVDPSLPLVARASGMLIPAVISGRLQDSSMPDSRPPAGVQLQVLQLLEPVLTPAPGTYITSVTVSITAEPGATVHYTTDGVTEPTEQSATYTGPLPIGVTTTIKAKAFNPPDWTPSSTVTGTYTVKAATPVITPNGGTYSDVRGIAVSTTTPGVTIRYTLTGADPLETDVAVGSTGTVLLGATATLKAKAFKAGLTASDTASADFTFPRLGAVTGGSAHSVAVTPEGTVWTWGSNSYGQLGDNTWASLSAVPVMVEGASDIIAVAAGALHSVALRTDGHVFAWGYNVQGELGDGSTGTRNYAVEVQTAPGQALTRVVAIAAGGYHSLALTADGTVWSWGANNYGQLGDGTTTQRTRPAVVPGVAGAIRIGAGDNHSLAVTSGDGSALAWGDNNYGQLGDGSVTRRLSPVDVLWLAGTAAVSARGRFSLSLGVDGLSWAWGDNPYGQLGDGTSARRTAPVRIVGLPSSDAVTAGIDHSLGLAEGEVWAWGRNNLGQLGDGSTSAQTLQPAVVPGLSDIVRIGSGQNTALAVSSGGTVYTWGSGAGGLLGDGTTSGDWTCGTSPCRRTPIAISGPGFAWRAGMPVPSVAPGSYQAPFNVTLTSATSGASIYYSTDGGDPTTLYTGAIAITQTTILKARATKAEQPDSNVTSALYTLKVLTPTFSPVAGNYPSGQTVTISSTTSGATIYYSTDGSDPGIPYATPVLIDSNTTLKARAAKTGWLDSDIRTGSYTFSRGTLAAPTLSPTSGTYPDSVTVSMSSIAGATIRYTTDSTDPTTSSPIYSSPIPLMVTTTIKAKAFHPEWTGSPTATEVYTIQVASTPTISLVSGDYPIGTSLTISTADPAATVVYTLDGSAPTSSSQSVPSGTTLYLMKALTLKAAALRAGCALSDPATASYTISGTAPAVRPAAGGLHSFVAKPDGSLWAWGLNSSGQLGDTTLTQRTLPVLLSSPTGVAGLAGGTSHTVAWTSGGAVWAWGYNYYGQVGDGTTTQRPTPVQLASPTGVAAVSTGASHTLAVKTNGTVWAWGRNNVGQLGNGVTTPEKNPTPLQVSSLAGVAGVAAGDSHSLAVKSDGTLWAWGANTYGQLGDNTTTQRNSPVQVSGLSGAIGASGGALHSLAVKSDGTVWAWGYNANGQLGDGTASTRKVPVAVGGLTGAVAVAAGYNHSFALLADGTLWAWGYNYYGQVGDGTTTSRTTPVRVAIPAAVVAVAAGANHSLAVTLDGTVWAWGQNTNGQLGLGTTLSPRPTPTRLSDSGYSWRVAVPTFDVAAGSYSTEKTVHPSSLTPGATICYSTDGSDPSSCQWSVPSGGAVQVAVSLTLRAIATKAGMSASAEAQAAYTLYLAAPTFSPTAGTKYSDLDVTINPPSGATVRYTTDGTDPDETNGHDYTAPVSVTQTETIRARAFRTGWAASSVASGLYTMAVANPALNPAGGSYGTAQAVSLTQTTTPNAPIHYTTDGREPTTDDPVASSVTVDHSLTLKAKCFRDGWTPSATVVGAYFLTIGSAAAPTMDPPGGSYDQPQLVVLGSATPGARIRYTTDGSVPNLFSHAYKGAVLVDTTTTLKAKAFAGDTAPSTTASAVYTITAPAVATPAFQPASGPFTTARNVTVTCATSGATIHYTTDGTDPTEGDATVVSGQTVFVDRSMTLKAKAWSGGLESAVRAGQYHVTGTVAAGGYYISTPAHSLALRSDGHVWAWGYNSAGQLGDGTVTNRTSPVEVQAAAGVPLTAVVAIDAGHSHSLAVKSDGTAWGWGYNYYGQLGSGTSTSAPVAYPVEVRRDSPTGPALGGALALAAGSYHSLALTSDGKVWAWGLNGNGQLGDGSTTSRPYAVRVVRASDSQPLDDVVAVAAGYRHSVALRSDGTVWGWGYGQGVDGSTSSLTKAVQVTGLGDGVGIAAGTDFSVASRVDGVLWAWGLNDAGQLGHGSTVAATRPTRVGLIAGAAEVDVGPVGHHVDTLVPGSTGDQRLWAWGAAGEMGDSESNPTEDRLWPAHVGSMVDVVSVSAGSSHTMLVQGDATVWTWGQGSGVQALGHSVAYPVYASTPAPVPNFTLADAFWVTADPDGDGLPTGYEWRLGTDPLSADTNGDGIPDGAAVHEGRDPNDLDTDGDGVRNSVEVELGTDPLRADTDGDGVGDAQDCFPLDPSRSQCLPPGPDDHTPPLINLAEPTSAVLISSQP